MKTHYINFNKENVEQFKSSGNMLKHAKTDDNVDGVILVNEKNELVGYIAWQDDFIVAFETIKKYRRHGYGTRMLKKAIKSGATKLSVNKSNKESLKMYKDFGFKRYKSDDSMIYMKISKNLNENLEKLNKVIIITESQLKRLLKNQ